MVKKRIFAVGGICAVGTDITNNNMTHSVLTGGCAVGATILVHVTRCGDTFIIKALLYIHTHAYTHACTYTDTHARTYTHKHTCNWHLIKRGNWYHSMGHCGSVQDHTALLHPQQNYHTNSVDFLY